MEPSERRTNGRTRALVCIGFGAVLASIPIFVHDPLAFSRAYTADDYYERGVNYLAKTLPELAIKDLELSLERDPYRVAGYRALAEGHLTVNRPERALSELRKALWLDPDDPGALTLRARAYEALGRADLAAADRDRADELRTKRAARVDRGQVGAPASRSNRENP